MYTHPYIARLAVAERYGRLVRDADGWRLAQEARANWSSKPLLDAYRGVCGLARRCAHWARGWRSRRLLGQH
jgi:hypothetical protein